jgi:alpha-glucosidase
MKQTHTSKFNILCKIFVLFILAFCMYPCSALRQAQGGELRRTAKENEYKISSPDEKISVFVWISGNKSAFYRIEFSGAIIIQQSNLGIIRNDSDFSNELSLEAVSDIETVKTDYELLQGKRRYCSYTANRRVFHLKNASGEKMDIIFQVSNDGAAFRYHFPEQSQSIKKIEQETTSFNFLSGTKAWIQPMTDAKSGWCQANPSYEENYRQGIETEKLAFNKAGWVFPAMFNYDKYWMLISETAPDRNYCGCRLRQDPQGNEFFIDFPQGPEVFTDGPLNPESASPWYTPWRIIAIGDSLKPIVESTLGTDLAEPPKLPASTRLGEAGQDISFVKPGRASWSWVMLKDGSVVYNIQKRFIDFAADMKWEYCLVDANWDTQIGYDKIKELAEYAQSKKVGLILWYNSAGDWNTVPYHPKSKLLTHQDRVKEFGILKEMGIKGVKVDFFGGDGQSMMAYYQDIFEDAAQFGLMVNCHGCTVPRGWQRTYPNLVTMESIRGFEFVTFEQANADLEPIHCCTIPFTRNVFDPMDFTPVCFSEVPKIKRITTNGFELALSVIFSSGIQHFAQTPEGMAMVPDYVKDFMREIPCCWDDTRFIDGFPGKLVVIARKFKNTWYVAGINGEDIKKRISFELDFLKAAKKAMLITDGKDNRSFKKTIVKIKPDKPLKMKLKGNGGFVIKVEN